MIKTWISNIAAVLWFFGVVLWALLLLPFVMMMLPTDIPIILESGFSTQTIGYVFLAGFGLIFGITMLIPAFRKCFRKLPWLYPYITTLMADLTIIYIGVELLNYGYQVQSDSRHTLFLWLMIGVMVLLRIAMCFYFHKRPMRKARDKHEQ